MKKNLIPILLAGAGAVIFFIMRKKKEVSPVEEIDETKEATFTTKPKKKEPAKKSFDINKAITNVSKLKNSKGGQIVQKAVKKKLAQKKSKNKTLPNTFVKPSQLKKPVPFI